MIPPSPLMPRRVQQYGYPVDPHALSVVQVMSLRNVSGAAVALGSSVKLALAGGGRSFTTSTTVGDERVLGITLEAVDSNAFGRVAFSGRVRYARVASGSTDGQFLRQSSTAGVLEGTDTPQGGSIAIQLGDRDSTTGIAEVYLVRARPAVTEFFLHNPAATHGSFTTAAAGNTGDFTGGDMVDGAKRSSLYTGRFQGTPLAVTLVVIPAGTGNLAWFATTDFAAAGEASTTNSDALGSDGTPQTTAVTNTLVTEIALTDAFTGAAAGDYFSIVFVRDGDDAADTVGAGVLAVGLRITY